LVNGHRLKLYKKPQSKEEFTSSLQQQHSLNVVEGIQTLDSLSSNAAKNNYNLKKKKHVMKTNNGITGHEKL
jgi:hypothetical protein